MNISLSHKYYLKACDAYPYDLNETMESLDYALSYNSDYAAAHSLLGRLHFEQTRDYTAAKYHFKYALYCDANYAATYEHYSIFLIVIQDFNTAKDILQKAAKIKGVSPVMLLHREALIAESTNNLTTAKVLMKKAYKHSCFEEERTFLKTELERIKSKLPKQKK